MVTLDLARLAARAWTPAESERAVRAHSRTAACSCCRACASRCRPDERRFLSPRVVRRPREEHQPRRRRDRRVRAAAPDDLRALAAHGRRASPPTRSGAGDRAVPALCAVRQARAHELPAAAGRGRDVSWRKDDSRLHVDAFPSRPNRGERILRVFCNVNPDGEPIACGASASRSRRWRRRCCRASARMRAGEAAVLAALHVTKGRRSEYDHLMLNLHDRAKADLDYQRECAAARGALRARHDVALLFRPGDARRVVGAIHARADHPSAARGALRSGALAARDPRAAHRARCADMPASCQCRMIPHRATTRSCARCGASPRRTRRSG